MATRTLPYFCHFWVPWDDFSPTLSGAEKHYGTQIYLPDKTYYSKVPLPSLAPQGKRHHGTQPRALILGFSCLLSDSPSSCSGKLYFCLKRQEALLVQYFGCPPCPSPQAILLSAHTCPFSFPDFLGFQNSKARTVLALFFCCVIASCRPMITAAWVLWVERILKQ